jgi:acetoin utilization deacetylase AcuC-like enzyme
VVVEGCGVRTRIVFSKKCLGYGSWHVEGPERVRRAREILGGRGYDFLVPEAASEDDLLRVHDHDYVWMVKKGLVEDGDTPAYDGIFDLARLSAGGAILAAQVKGFSLMRPPGHHAGARGIALDASTRGFCYFNNMAIAVRHLGKRTLILDIDGHHGNGTQEIFFGDEKVVYVSLHRHPNFPGTGVRSEGNCLNFPLPPDCGGAVYLEALDAALGEVNVGRFEVVGVSAGFDTHDGDLASLGLSGDVYEGIGRRIGGLAKPTFFVLEGGYNGEDVGNDVDRLLRGFESKSG